MQQQHRYLGAVPLISALVAACAVIGTAMPATAQFFLFDDRYPAQQRQRVERQPERQADFSRAPAPTKTEANTNVKILVLGDSMADWLAYGLEDALSETPEIGILRKHRAFSGLIRYEARTEADWAQVARDLIAAEKPQAVIMMLGVQDRQPIRDRATRPATKSATPAATKPGQPAAATPPQNQAAAANNDPDEAPSIAAPELQKARADGMLEYRSERWAEVYGARIDEVIAALKTGNVPVLWVGLPSIRGTRSTSDAMYLNELYRARAEKAGILYVDPWDGFVDERGNFVVRGPDFEGQIRPLRTGDGVHFTKFGARKLAHYVERDLRRVLREPIPVALTNPAEPVRPGTPLTSAPAPVAAKPASPAAPAARPLAGPVVLLASPADEPEELLGGGKVANATLDPAAMRVLVRGERSGDSAGRSDDFSWPPRLPNLVAREPLPPSGTPIVAASLGPKIQAQQPVLQAAAAPAPGAPRVAGQQVLQGQVQRQAQQQRPFWRQDQQQQRPSGFGFFGLFGGRW